MILFVGGKMILRLLSGMVFFSCYHPCRGIESSIFEGRF